MPNPRARRDGSPTVRVLAPGLLGPWPGKLHRDVAAGLSPPGLCEFMRGARPASASRPQRTEAEPWSLEALILESLYSGFEWPARAPLDLESLAPTPGHSASSPAAAVGPGFGSGSEIGGLQGSVGEGSDYPFAAVTYAFDALGARPSEWVMRCDPVHLRTDVGTAYLFGEEHLGLELGDAQALASELNAHLREDGLEIETPAPARWYLRLSEPPSMGTTPPSLVAGREVGRFLPTGDEGGAWRRRFNEMQMLLHASPINAQRESRGQLAVNSLWFWGVGKLPHPVQVQPNSAACIWADHALAGGCGALGWAAAEELPIDAEAFAAKARSSAHILVLHDAHGAVLSNDVESWRFSIMEADEAWIEPLMGALDRGEIARLELDVGLVPGTRVYTRTKLRWWKRSSRVPALGAVLGATDEDG